MHDSATTGGFFILPLKNLNAKFLKWMVRQGMCIYWLLIRPNWLSAQE
ncbi:hypothetical protein ECDEC5B_5648 [Escherichia coli DEC5B]|nr:hypothetical protein ECDEC5B_5648 [Escherichia coli DEC5B]